MPDAQHEIGKRYEIIRPLGEGGMARVDLARDGRDGSLCSVKWTLSDKTEFALALRQEFRLRRHLPHPQLPAVRALGRDHEPDITWLAAEYAEGSDLIRALANWGLKALPRLLAQGLNVVGFLHRRHIVHGDVKPENIIVTPAGAGQPLLLRLLDFGLATEIETDATPDTDQSVGGTRAFMAPSMLRGEAASFSTDLFALGRSFEEALKSVVPETSHEEAGTQAARDVITRLVHPDADLRYRLADDALRDLAAHDPTLLKGLPKPTEAPLFGRRPEWTRLTQALGRLRAGLLETQVILLQGPAGSGKTRLLAELHDDALLENVAVIRVRIPRPAGPLEVLLQLARRLLPTGAPETEAIERLARRPEGRGQLPAGVLRDLWTAFQQAGRKRPMLILLDELEHADAPTKELLRLASRLPAPAGPLIVAASASESRAARRLVLEPGVDTVELGLLEIPDAAQLIAALLPPDRAAGNLPAELAASCAGNPRLATLLAQEHHALEGGEVAEGQRLLDHLLLARLAKLEPAARDLLADLAVLLRTAPVALLASLVGDDRSDCAATLDELVRVGLAESEWRNGAHHYRIAGELLRERLLSTLARDDLRARHAAAYRAWAAWPRSADRPAEMQLEHAIAADDVENALGPGRGIALRLAAQGNLATAERLLRDLLRLAERSRPKEALKLKEELCNVLVRAGDTGEARTCLEEVLDRISVRETLGDEALRGRLLLSLGTLEEACGNLDEARQALEQAASVAPERMAPEQRLRMWERLGAVHFRHGRHEDARRAWEKGLAEAPQDAADLERADLLNNLGALDTWQLRFDKARARHEEALLIRRSHKDIAGESFSLVNLANLALKQSDFTGARRHYEQSLRIMRQMGTLREMAGALSNLASVCNLQGEYAEALLLLEESLDLRRRCRDTLGEAATCRQLASLYLNKSEVGKAASEMKKARGLLEAAGAGDAYAAPYAVQEAELALQRGDLTGAIDGATQMIDALPHDTGSMQRYELLLLRGRTRLTAGEVLAAAHDLQQALEGFEAKGDKFNRAWTQLALGRVAMAQGRLQRAELLFQKVAQAGRHLGARRLTAEAALARAQFELACGDAERAPALLAEATRLAQILGVPDLLLAIQARKAMQALHHGHRSQAAAWLRRCLEGLMAGLDRLGEDGDDALYLAHPERAWIPSTLERLLASPLKSEPPVKKTTA